MLKVNFVGKKTLYSFFFIILQAVLPFRSQLAIVSPNMAWKHSQML